MRRIEESELILNADGSIFHLHLLPEDISTDIILVGDPGRVETVSSFFDEIEVKKSNREFHTHTGTYKGKRITVISTAIGTDNIDIVVNELDAIANIDLNTRIAKEKHTKLNIIRLGTSGALQKDIPVDTYVASVYSVGFDGMLNYYAGRNSVSDLVAEEKFKKHTDWNPQLASPYFVIAAQSLVDRLASDMRHGLTISAPGFYGPQGRELRLPLMDPKMNEKLASFDYDDLKITNYEMEGSAINGLCRLLGHDSITICAIIANRDIKQYSKDYKPVVRKLIEQTLNRLTK